MSNLRNEFVRIDRRAKTNRDEKASTLTETKHRKLWRDMIGHSTKKKKKRKIDKHRCRNCLRFQVFNDAGILFSWLFKVLRSENRSVWENQSQK